MSPFQFLVKVFLVLLITAGGAAVTCGGNMLVSITGILDTLPHSLSSLILYFWFFEIVLIGLWAIWRVFYGEKSGTFAPIRSKKQLQFLSIFSVIAIAGILGLLYFFISSL